MTIDYKKTVHLLEVFNTVLRQSGAERDFYYEGKNLLASFQMSLFSDLKAYTSNPGRAVVRKRSVYARMQTYIVQLLIMILSILSFAYLWIRYSIFGREVVGLYSIDVLSDKALKRDARVSHMYTYIQEHKEPTVEFMHSVPSLQTIKNYIVRRSPVMYIESVRFIVRHAIRPNISSVVTSASFAVSDCTETDASFLYALFVKYSQKKAEYIASQRIYTYILRRFNMRRFWTIDDTRYTAELLQALSHTKTVSYMFQHGHYTKYHVGFLSGSFIASEIVAPTYIVVWNTYFKNELIRLKSYFTEKQILIGGEKKSVKPYRQRDSLRTISTVLIPYETDAPKLEVRQYIDNFIEQGKTVYFKLRKDIPKEIQLKQYGFTAENIPSNCIAVVDESEVLHKIDVVAGVYSTYLYDMLYLGVPVLILDASMDYGLGMIAGGLAILYTKDMTDEQVLQKYTEISHVIKGLYGTITYVDTCMKNFA